MGRAALAVVALAVVALVGTAVAGPVSANSVSAGDSGFDGALSLRWGALSGSNSLSPEYQDLRGRLRLSTAPVTARGLRLHLEAAGRQGLDERFAYEGVALAAVADSAAAPRNRYQNRHQLRRAFLELADLGGGQLQLGRHRSPLRALGLGDTDGVSWTRATASWTASLTGGYRVAFWKPDADFDGSAPQAGAEVRLHPSGRWSLGAAAARDEAWNGDSRWRLAADGAVRPRDALYLSARAAVDPVEGRWLLGRLGAALRPGPVWNLGLDYTERRLALFPVADLADSSLYGGRSRDLSLTARRRWGRANTASLRLLSRYGDRPYRSETLHLRWGHFQRRDWALSLRASDSWSPWRQLERLSVEWQARWGRRWHTAVGLHADLFQWRTSRSPQWRARLRPRLAVRRTLGRAWVWDLEMEETVDEFQNLRTRASSGVTYRW